MSSSNSSNTDQNSALQAQFAEVFARLPEQDIEQFYAHYQLWLLRRREPLIEKQLEFLHAHLSENQHLIASLRPSVIALAVLVRLQSCGVSDIDVLDQMLERGEDWLDRMMQRLDYCEQVEDFIQGDYTQWCIRSLEGAYDWIDTVLGLGAPIAEPEISYTSTPDVSALEATEELLLQKLTLDDEDEMLETTLKQPVIEADRAQQDEREVGTQPEAAQEEQQPGTASGELEMSIPQQQPAAYDEIEVNIAEEFLLVRESVTETQANTAEGEEAVEIADWEALESAELRPEPWYSVNLAADASSDAQPDMMHDWINVLQADAPRTESGTSEVTEVNAEAQPMPAEEAIQAASVAPTSAETSEAEPVAQATPGDLTETPSSEEVQNEPEMSVEAEVAPVVAEVQEEPEASLESEATALVAEMVLAESADAATVGGVETVEAGQEVELPIDESAAISEDVEPEDASIAEETSVASGVEIETLEQSSVERDVEVETPEETSIESAGEAETTEQLSVESAGDVVEVEAAEQESVVVETSEQSPTEIMPTETPEAQAAEVEIVEQPGDSAEPSEQATIEDQPGVNVAAPLARSAAEPPVTPIFVSDASSETVDEAATLPRLASTTLPESDEAKLATREVEQAQETEAVSWGYLPADETLFGAESNARPWYEYLAQDEQVAQMPQNWGETEVATEVEAAHSAGPAELSELAIETPELPEAASIEPNEASEVALPEAAFELQETAPIEQNEVVEAALQEATSVEQSAAEALPAESTLQAQLERLERERTEGQGWEMFPEIDATQPMIALKGQQRMRKAPQRAEPEVPVNGAEEEQHVVADEFGATSEPGEVSSMEQTELAASEPSEAPQPQVQGEISEMPVALIRDEMRSIQDEMKSIHDKVLSIQNEISEVSASPVPPVLVAVPRVREEPEKVGFWRRLFGWMRKK